MRKATNILLVLGISVLGFGVFYVSQKVNEDNSAESSNAAVEEYGNLNGIGTKYATVFFYWHWCQSDHIDPATASWRKEVCENQARQLTNIPRGFLEKDPTFGWYDEKNYNWVLSQLKDMETSLLDYVLIDTWRIGKSEWEPPNLVNIVPNIKKAIDENQTKLKFGMFIETGGVKWDYEKIKGIQDSEHNKQLTLSSRDDADILVNVIYDELDYFYGQIPRSNWAIDKNNQPYVLFFDYQNFLLTEESKSEYLSYILSQVNLKFESKYNVKPSLIVIWEWLYNGIDYSQIYSQHMVKQPKEIYGENYNQSVLDNVVGAFSWSTYGYPQAMNIKDTVVGNVSPGFNKCNWLKQNDPVQGENCYALQNVNKVFYRKEGEFLKENFLNLNDKVLKEFDLVVFESWGELYEGTSLQRTLNYPKYDSTAKKDLVDACNNSFKDPSLRDNNCLPEDFYLNKLKELIYTYGRHREVVSGAEIQCENQDVNADDTITIVDLANLLSKYKKHCSNSADELRGICTNQDSNNDGKIELVDLTSLLSKYKKNCN